MAAEGGFARNDTNTQYYPVSGTDELVSVLTQIGGQIATRSFKPDSPPLAPDNVAVDTESEGIPDETTHAAGWDYADSSMSAIQVYGRYCDDVRNGTIKKVQAIFGCPGQPVP